MKKTRKKAAAFIMVLALAAGIAPANVREFLTERTAIVADAANAAITYQTAAWNDATQKVEYSAAKATDYTIVTSSSNGASWEKGKTYVVNGNVDIYGRINVYGLYGTVNLILCDGATLNAHNGIFINRDCNLTIFGQKGGTGTLNATGSSYDVAGISKVFEGTLTINGGIINATGGEHGAGINAVFGASLTINGGTVTANGGPFGAGIRGSDPKFNRYITINGGTITANGGDYAAGIGGDYDIPGSSVRINGGTVTATGGVRTYAIGAGLSNSDNGVIALGENVSMIGKNGDGQWTEITQNNGNYARMQKMVAGNTVINGEVIPIQIITRKDPVIVVEVEFSPIHPGYPSVYSPPIPMSDFFDVKYDKSYTWETMKDYGDRFEVSDSGNKGMCANTETPGKYYVRAVDVDDHNIHSAWVEVIVTKTDGKLIVTERKHLEASPNILYNLDEYFDVEFLDDTGKEIDVRCYWEVKERNRGIEYNGINKMTFTKPVTVHVRAIQSGDSTHRSDWVEIVVTDTKTASAFSGGKLALIIGVPVIVIIGAVTFTLSRRRKKAAPEQQEDT